MNKPCISIDVEDWLQSTWDRSLPVSKISSENTLRLLDILNELSIKTTMFVQGKFAKAFPEVVKQINYLGMRLLLMVLHTLKFLTKIEQISERMY